MMESNLRKKEFILAHDSRGIRIHHMADMAAGAETKEILCLTQAHNREMGEVMNS